MKRIILSVAVLLIILAGSAFAVMPKMGVGGYIGGLGTGPMNAVTSFYMPTLTLQILKDFNTEIGLSFGSMNDDITKGSDSQFNLLLKGDVRISGIQHVGAAILYSSDSNYAVVKDGDAGSGFGLGVYYGIRANVTNDFVVSLDLYPLTFSSYSIGGDAISTFGMGKVAMGGTYYLQ